MAHRPHFLWLVGAVIFLAGCMQTLPPSTLGDLEPASAPFEATRNALPGSLYEQLDDQTNVSAAGGGFSSAAAFVADDFAVPPGVRWTLEEVGFENLGGRLVLPEYTLGIFEEHPVDPEVPGALIATQSFDHDDTVLRDGLRVVTLEDPVVLPPGTYWFGVNGYFVRLRTPPAGQRAARGTTGSFVPLDTHRDLLFALFGTSEPWFDLAPLLATFDDAVLGRTLVGTGPARSAAPRLATLRTMLVRAGELAGVGDTDAACLQLADAMKRLHVGGRIQADHFATGSGAGDLRDMIVDLQSEACSAD